MSKKQYSYILQRLCRTWGVMICIATLAACSDFSPTDRTLPPSSSTISYRLVVASPVLIKNATVRIRFLDAQNPVDIATVNFDSGGANHVIINIAQQYTNASKNLFLATLEPKVGSSYYDPIIGQYVPLTKPLHALFRMNNGELTIKIDPFSEIAFWRSLVRSGVNNLDTSLSNTITLAQAAATNIEMLNVFQVAADQAPPPFFNTRANIAQVSPSGYSDFQIFNFFLALGHYQLQKTENASDTTPYITFAERASHDMLDGDLDGMTIFGQGDHDGIMLDSSIVAAEVNDDPSFDLPISSDERARLDDQDARRNYATRLENATKAFFNQLNAQHTVNSTLMTRVTNFNYLNGTGSIGLHWLHSLGAGNYTNAFGTINTSLVYGLNSDDTSFNELNVLSQLVGLHENGPCKLNIASNGYVTLTSGATSHTTEINRENADNLLKTSTGYRLNIARAGTSPIQFIQIMTTGSHLDSAKFGESSESAPDTLSNVSTSCTF